MIKYLLDWLACTRLHLIEQYRNMNALLQTLYFMSKFPASIAHVQLGKLK